MTLKPYIFMTLKLYVSMTLRLYNFKPEEK